MQVVAQLNNLRIAPRKVRLVAQAIKGMDALVAKHQLNYVIKKSSKPITKLLDSALANAHNNFGLVKDNLFIKDIVVNEGPKLKRFRPKGFGMASPIEKKTSHIKVVLEERVPNLRGEKLGIRGQKSQILETERVGTDSEHPTSNIQPPTSGRRKPEAMKELGKKGGIFGQVGKIKKFFRRKTI